MRVCHYEDRAVADLEPLTLTRPAFDLLCGQTSLADKQARHFQASERTAVVRPHLSQLAGLPAPIAASGLFIVVNGRWLPPAAVAVDLSEPFLGLVGNEPAYAVVDAANFTARRRRPWKNRWRRGRRLCRAARPAAGSSTGSGKSSRTTLTRLSPTTRRPSTRRKGRRRPSCPP